MGFKKGTKLKEICNSEPEANTRLEEIKDYYLSFGIDINLYIQKRERDFKTEYLIVEVK